MANTFSVALESISFCAVGTALFPFKLKIQILNCRICQNYLTGINLISFKSSKPLSLSFEVPLNTIFWRPAFRST